MDHGPMVTSGIGHRARRRLSRGSPEPLLPQRRPFDSPSSRSMDVSVHHEPLPVEDKRRLASIRARRARLEALTASIKLPPLVPSDVLPPSSASARESPLFRGMMLPETPRRRITWEERPLTGRGSPEPRLPPTLPRMATPHHPLPSIGQSREEVGDFLADTPEEEEEEEEKKVLGKREKDKHQDKNPWEVLEIEEVTTDDPLLDVPSEVPTAPEAITTQMRPQPSPPTQPSPPIEPAPLRQPSSPPQPSHPPPLSPIEIASYSQPSPPPPQSPTLQPSSSPPQSPPPQSSSPKPQSPPPQSSSPPPSSLTDPITPIEPSPPTQEVSPPTQEASPPTQPSLPPPTSSTRTIPLNEEAPPPDQPSPPPATPTKDTPPTHSSPPRPTRTSPHPPTSPSKIPPPTQPSLKTSSSSIHSASSTQPAPSTPTSTPAEVRVRVPEEEDSEVAFDSISISSTRRQKPRDPKDFPNLVAKMSSSNRATRTAATVRVRQLLSSSHDAPIDEMLKLDVLTPALANLQENNPALQYETVWIITNIVSGTTEQTQTVADRGFVPVLVKLVASGEHWVKEQAAWALGNMAADSSHLRNQIVEAGALKPLAKLTRPQAKVSSLHKVVWALSNIFKLKNLKASPEDIRFVLEVFRDHLLTHKDEEVVADALWTLTYLTDAGSNEAIQLVVETGLLPMLVESLSSRSRQIVYPSIRTLGTIVSGTDSQTEAALDSGMLPPLHVHLKEAREVRRTKEATWALSNITAGTVEQIQKVVDEGFLHTLVHLIQNGVVDVAREAVWAVSNLVAGGSSGQVEALVAADGIFALMNTLKPPAPHRLDLITVDTLLTILEKTRGGEAVQHMEEAGGVEVLKEKLSHEDEEVVERAREILETYFPDAVSEDEDED